MRIVDVLKKRTLLNALYGTLAVAYFLCMVVVPLFNGHFEWSYLLSVWQDWQTINASMIALTSTVIALNIAKVKEDNERERRFVAARASMPHVLSDLTNYCRKCGPILLQFWENPELRRTGARETTITTPQPPEKYLDILSRCIEHAEPSVGQFLADLLGRLQVLNARLSDLIEPRQTQVRVLYSDQEIVVYIFSLGVIQAMLNKLFDFARDNAPFDARLTVDDCINAYLNVDIHEVDVAGLRQFTEKKINKGL